MGSYRLLPVSCPRRVGKAIGVPPPPPTAEVTAGVAKGCLRVVTGPLRS